MHYFYFIQNIVLQCFVCLSTLFPFCMFLGWFWGRWTLSNQINIRNCFIFHAILQRTTMRHQSSHSFEKWNRLWRFAFHLHLLLRFVQFVFIQISVLLRHICMPLFIFIMLRMHPPPPCLGRLQKIKYCYDHYIMWLWHAPLGGRVAATWIFVNIIR